MRLAKRRKVKLSPEEQLRRARIAMRAMTLACAEELSRARNGDAAVARRIQEGRLIELLHELVDDYIALGGGVT